MITSQDHHKIVRGLEILEGLAEKDGNVPFLVDIPVNTLQVIFNALLLGDLQVSEGVVQCTDCRHSLAAKCYAGVVYYFLLHGACSSSVPAWTASLVCPTTVTSAFCSCGSTGPLVSERDTKSLLLVSSQYLYVAR